MIRCIAGTLLTVLVVSSAAVAQETGDAAQAPGIASGATIFVLDNKAVEHRGRFLRFDDQELVMVVGDDERRFRRDVITRIERRGDSLKNGAIIGAIVGGAIGVLMASAMQGQNLGSRIGLAALATGGYAAMGTCLDAMVQGRTVVDPVWPSAPVRQQGGAALAFSVRW